MKSPSEGNINLVIHGNVGFIGSVGGQDIENVQNVKLESKSVEKNLLDKKRLDPLPPLSPPDESQSQMYRVPQKKRGISVLGAFQGVKWPQIKKWKKINPP